MEKKPFQAVSRAIISTSFFVKVTGDFFSPLIVGLLMQIGTERQKANHRSPSEWFFLNYLRKLGGEGTFSQLISQSHSARICDYFLAYPAALPL
ncbi:MAG: hypothetical protein E7J63_11140 [Pantoea sp.]|uniref:hypothetical protein n=1 Tax=Pantoea sp. TaxID=69393 RepID=UPI00290E4C7B|nr:hypothetical protein [Pantoea sp.]MDU7838851.1 hypothetical protein [Pantoea sp.]